MTQIQIKRVYDPVEENDGVRILVDRMWPRGFTKEKLHADLWLKDLAPSPDLIKQYHHDKISWLNFETRYLSELKLQAQAVADLLELASQKSVTLLFASRNLELNQAIVLREYLLSKPK